MSFDFGVGRSVLCAGHEFSLAVERMQETAVDLFRETWPKLGLCVLKQSRLQTI